MKLRRLILQRYGHLADVTLEFPETPGLALVLGANEAGKSTALAAIGDALFGFEHRTDYAFQYATSDLRIGVDLQAADGRHALFWRRKGNKDTLRDESDKVVPDSTIAAFLGNATREKFENTFGLNGTRLRSGGRSILEQQGDAASTIISAFAGGRDYRAIIKALDEKAKTLFGDGRGQREFSTAATIYADAKRRVREIQVDPKDYTQKLAEQEAATHAQSDARTENAALSAQRVKLERIRRTTPIRRRLESARANLASLGPIPDLPANASEILESATTARNQARRDRDREAETLAQTQTALAALPTRDEISDVADQLDALTAGRKSFADSVRDRPQQALLADQKSAEMTAAAKSLGLTWSASDLAVRLPGRLDREFADGAVHAFNQTAAKRQGDADLVAEATHHQQACQRAVDALPEPPPAQALRTAIDLARQEGKLDDDLAKAERTRDRAHRGFADALAALPLWPHDAEALANHATPLAPAIDHAATSLDRTEATLAQAKTRLVEHNNRLAELNAAIDAASVTGDVPTQAVIAIARARRDAAWTLIRRAHLDHGAAITDAERAQTTLGPDTASGFDHLLREADRLADQRAQQQLNVLKLEQNQRDYAEQTHLRTLALTQVQAAQTERDAAWAHWAAIWEPTGVAPQSPPEMKSWLAARQIVLEKRDAWRDAAAEVDAMLSRRATAITSLIANLPENAGSGPSLAPVLHEAQNFCTALEAKHQELHAARKALAEAQRTTQRREAALAESTAELTRKTEAWASIATRLGLPAETEPALGRTVLQAWSHIAEASVERTTALGRVHQMTVTIDTYTDALRALATRLAPEQAASPSLDLIRQFTDRLKAAQTTEAERARLAKEIADLKRAIATHTTSHDQAHAQITDLQTRAAVPDEQALREAIGNALKARTLTQEIDQARQELLTAGDGKSEAELVADAEGTDFDTLPALVAEIDRKLSETNERIRSTQEQITTLSRELADMEKIHEAASAEQSRQNALADIASVVQRYPPLRMAETLLRTGIENFRRQQQGPLLARASTLFATLTHGRYTKLDIADGDKNIPLVIARTPNDTSCPADQLSEGTRDQLYLALRLAALEPDLTGTEPLPFIGDDLLVNFDDQRAAAALSVLAEFSARTQVILFSHHAHVARLVQPGATTLIRLAA